MIKHEGKTLYSYTIQTPLGTLVAFANDYVLHMLRFADDKKFTRDTAFFKTQYGDIVSGFTLIHKKIEQEITAYFEGGLKNFTVPLRYNGTEFQQSVWDGLQTIEYGRSVSYKELAKYLNKPKAFRAVALANSVNRFVLIVPCHRVIASDGTLGGYACGIEKKKWLLAHEERYKNL